jgi:outer membrane protein OmpA-like peptidoglycan-associated protein
MYIKTDEGLGQAPMVYGSIAGVLGDALPAPPVDTSAVSGCTTAAKPFDDFPFGSAAVPAKHEPRIKELAQIIVQSWMSGVGIRTVCLEGHTDKVGKADFNKKLGLARAKNLRSALKQAIVAEATKVGFPQIAPSVTILVSSKGQADPVAPNTTSLGRRRNRRVRFAFST